MRRLLGGGQEHGFGPLSGHGTHLLRFGQTLHERIVEFDDSLTLEIVQSFN